MFLPIILLMVAGRWQVWAAGYSSQTASQAQQVWAVDNSSQTSSHFLGATTPAGPYVNDEGMILGENAYALAKASKQPLATVLLIRDGADMKSYLPCENGKRTLSTQWVKVNGQVREETAVEQANRDVYPLCDHSPGGGPLSKKTFDEGDLYGGLVRSGVAERVDVVSVLGGHVIYEEFDQTELMDLIIGKNSLKRRYDVVVGASKGVSALMMAMKEAADRLQRGAQDFDFPGVVLVNEAEGGVNEEYLKAAAAVGARVVLTAHNGGGPGESASDADVTKKQERLQETTNGIPGSPGVFLYFARGRSSGVFHPDTHTMTLSLLAPSEGYFLQDQKLTVGPNRSQQGADPYIGDMVRWVQRPSKEYYTPESDNWLATMAADEHHCRTLYLGPRNDSYNFRPLQVASADNGHLHKNLLRPVTPEQLQWLTKMVGDVNPNEGTLALATAAKIDLTSPRLAALVNRFEARRKSIRDQCERVKCTPDQQQYFGTANEHHEHPGTSGENPEYNERSNLYRGKNPFWELARLDGLKNDWDGTRGGNETKDWEREEYLLHGTSPESIPSICETGFLTFTAGKLSYPAIYFAEDIKLAYSYGKPDEEKLQEQRKNTFAWMLKEMGMEGGLAYPDVAVSFVFVGRVLRGNVKDLPVEDGRPVDRSYKEDGKELLPEGQQGDGPFYHSVEFLGDQPGLARDARELVLVGSGNDRVNKNAMRKVAELQEAPQKDPLSTAREAQVLPGYLLAIVNLQGMIPGAIVYVVPGATGGRQWDDDDRNYNHHFLQLVRKRSGYWLCQPLYNSFRSGLERKMLNPNFLRLATAEDLEAAIVQGVNVGQSAGKWQGAGRAEQLENLKLLLKKNVVDAAQEHGVLSEQQVAELLQQSG